MRQLVQDLSSGETRALELPAPAPRRGNVLIRSHASLISPGTERMLVDFGRAGWLSKARQQPEKVREVLQKVRTDGLAPTIDAVRSKLDEPLPLGYCNVGTVESVGADVPGIRTGDRVASNGAHAELVSVPGNLCVPVPSGVSDGEAAFTVIGAIALQGVRLAQPTMGECFVVTGLGLVGLVAVQLLRANGCRVLAMDVDRERTAMARSFGAETVELADGQEPLEAAAAFSRNRGVDGVLLTLSTATSEPVSQAARMCRKHGRLVLVGVAGLELNRADFYEKELTFQVSCSYGPGRYDPAYEEGGQDYPVGYVRWTEQRNFEAVLDLMVSGRLDVKPLISHRVPLADAEGAYELLTSGEPSLGILLEYPAARSGEEAALQRRAVALTPAGAAPNRGSVAFLGAGNYAGRVLIPAFRAAGAYLHTVVSSGGLSAVHRGKRFGFASASTDGASVLADEGVDTVVIATRHDAHARQVLDALRAGKHVFCEKPLCLTDGELAEIEQEAAARTEQRLMVGFNRRFAPHVVRMKALLEGAASPKSFVMTVNAGHIPPDHWTQDPDTGGGRIVGEACHFIDLLRHLAGCRIVDWHVTSMAGVDGVRPGDDCAAITLQFEDGSFGTIHYLANGHRSVPKERLEVFCGGRHLYLDNFRVLRGRGWRGFRTMRLWRQDKGQRSCAAAFINAVREGTGSPVPPEEILEVSRVSIACARLASGG